MSDSDFHNRETLAADPDPMVGRRIEERWRIVRRLGGGGFGDVYLAEDERLDGRRTVVKFLRPAALADPIARVKFDDERRALARLSELRHPGLGEIYGAGTLEDQTPYLVMQFIAGVSLENRLRERGTLSLAECADVVTALGDALAAVHGAGVIHRDVKPSNVMLSPEPGGGERVVLIDFGIARTPVTGPPDPNRPPTFGLGTLAYAAPEQFSPTARLTPTCDVYALAATAYQLLTGRPPFPTRPNVDLHAFDADRRNGLAAAARAARPEISAAADALLTAALAYEPERRPADAGRFGADLAAALRADGAPGRRVEIPVGPAARRTDGGRKFWLNRRRAAAGAGALALVCALGGYAAWRRASEPAPRTNPPPAVTDAPAAPASEPEREVSYAMEIQRMRNGKPDGAPYFGTGRAGDGDSVSDAEAQRGERGREGGAGG
jgi:serine/threonine-protein kinase